MKLNHIRIFLLLMALILWNVLLLGYINGKVLQINCFPEEIARSHFRNQDITEDTLDSFYQASDADMELFSEWMAMYYATDCLCTDTELLKEDIAFVKEYQPEKFNALKKDIFSIFSCADTFPVGKIEKMPRADVSFYNSWNDARLYGGERVHEGCDIMATVNERGIYPVLSVSDGVVEKIGWLDLGGYRIGIRSETGVYFYYAHLYEYAKDFEIGEQVSAGTLLGYMGDSGYGEEGTIGKFDVHLHFGIYLNDTEGREYSVNPYPFLCYLQKKQ